MHFASNSLNLNVIELFIFRFLQSMISFRKQRMIFVKKLKKNKLMDTNYGHNFLTKIPILWLSLIFLYWVITLLQLLKVRFRQLKHSFL